MGSSLVRMREVMTPFDDPDVIAVLGKCKKCGEGAFVNKDGICVKCL